MSDSTYPADSSQDAPAGRRLSESHLFLVRIWNVPGRDGTHEWHGKVQHVLTGSFRSFRSLPELEEALASMVPERVDGSTSKSLGDGGRS